jgi:serine/threonine-protein kinase
MNPEGLLTAAGWARLQELFEAASQLPPEQRPDFLDRECAGQSTLRTQVESLLRSLDGESVIERAVRGAVAAAASPGDRLGLYQVIRILGHGGMGVVYLAARADDAFQKVVAIKLLRTAWLSDDMRRRFQLERQILARLEHPNIARLLDGGTVEGAPFVVMEYVDGLPIDQYCRERGLSVRERLALFRQLCDAVAYAHRNLVIHRDIKPGNVLVAEGTPKLLDFGIAKLLQSDAEGGAMTLTQTGDRPMTPDYASPEQVRGEPISTGSDIYSLGVLLYELLADERPFRTSGLTPGEIERAICTQEPPKPSTRASRRGLEGDLDNIVAMAMRKEPARRYATAEQLSEDVRRYLEGFPVAARRDTWRYRASKFVRRHKLAMSGAVAMTALIIAFAVGMALLARGVTVERDSARAERTRAQQISNFLLDTFKVSDVQDSDPNKVTAREILDRGAETIAKQNLDPAINADMLDTLGLVYENLAVYPRAQQELERARELKLKLYGPASAEYAHTLDAMAGLKAETGAWNEAEKLARQVIALRVGHPEMDQERGGTLLTLSMTVGKLGRYEEARQAATEALAIFRKSSGDHRPQIALAEARIAAAFIYQGKMAEAEPLLRDALAIEQQVSPGDNAKKAELFDGLGHIRLGASDLKQAEKYWNEALRMYTSLEGESRLAISVENNLAVTYNWEGNLPAAIAMNKRVISAEHKLSGDSNPESLTFMGNLGVNLHNQGNHKEEAALAADMARIAAQKDPGAFLHLTVMRAQDTVLADRAEYAKAERNLREEIEKRRALGMAPRLISPSYSDLGIVLLAEGKSKEAEQAGRAAVTQIPAKDQSGLPAGRADERLARILALTGKNSEAREVVNKTISIFHATSGPTYFGLATALLTLGEVDLAEGHSQEAAKSFEQALAIRTQIMIPNAFEIALAESALARSRKDIAKLRTLNPTLNRCAAASFECKGELQRVRKTLAEGRSEEQQ